MSLWDDIVNSDFMQQYVKPAWNSATTPLFNVPKTGDEGVDNIIDMLVPNTPLSLALSAMPALRTKKYLGKAINETKPIAGAAGKISASEIPGAIRDEIKQIALTSGIPGTAVNSFSVSQGAAHLKGTPLRELPREAYETARMLWNPERAKELNAGLTGGKSPAQVAKDVRAMVLQLNPNATERDITNATDTYINWYRQQPNIASTRFGDIVDLEKPTRKGGGGLKTSDILGGNASTDKQFLTRPVMVGNKNINPLSWQRELFDTPYFGEEGPATYWKRKTALDELDRARNVGVNNPLEQASNFATDMLGGYGKDSPSVFNSDIAKWTLTAPDWTRRHFTLAGKKLQSMTTQLSNPAYHPYRRALGYDVAAGLGAAGATKALTGSYKTTRPQDQFDIQLPGDFNGRTGRVRPEGTEMDLPKYAWTVGKAAESDMETGNSTLPNEALSFWKNRLHPFTRTGLDLLMNSDWRGRSLYGQEKFTKYSKQGPNTVSSRPDISAEDAMQRIGQDLFGNVAPQTATALQKKYTNPDSMSDLEFYSQLGEMPFQFFTPSYQKSTSPFERRQKSRERRFFRTR